MDAELYAAQPIQLQANLRGILIKVQCILHRGPRYLEVDLDVGSSRSASHVVGLVNGALKGLTIDLAIVLEGRFQARPPTLLSMHSTEMAV